MLVDLGLLPHVTMARQDSGTLERFAALFPQTNKMASEIEKYAEIASACRLGYVVGGAGGFFGEKRRTCSEFSIAGKLVKTLRAPTAAEMECAERAGAAGAGVPRVVVGYAGKLGDADGSWVGYDTGARGLPVKFIASVEAPRQRLWEQLLAYGQKGDARHDEQIANGCEAPPAPLLRRTDACALAAALHGLLASSVLSDPRYAAVAGRLAGFAREVEAAAARLSVD